MAKHVKPCKTFKHADCCLCQHDDLFSFIADEKGICRSYESKISGLILNPPSWTAAEPTPA